MHYANGREAKVGDKIIGQDVNEQPIGGMVTEIFPDTDTCNANVVLTGSPTHLATTSKCLHVDDLLPIEKV